MKILVIGAGWEQEALLSRMSEMGHDIIATHPTSDAESFFLAAESHVIDSRDINRHIQLVESRDIDAVVTDNCDYSFYTASVVAARFGFSFAEIRSAVLSNDKYAQRKEVSNKEAIQQPEFEKVFDLESLKRSARQIGYPVIVKPVDNRGTFGISVVHQENELDEAFFEAIANSHSRVLICEQFIEGILATVDGFCFGDGHRSLTVASSMKGPGRKPVTKETIYPAQFSRELIERLLKTHHNVVTTLGYGYGHTHGEYIVTESGEIWFVECTNRGGGVYISSVIVPLITGIDVNERLIEQSLGMNRPLDKKEGVLGGYMESSVVLAFRDLEVGRVLKRINFDEVCNLSGTVKFRTIFKVGDTIETIENCAGRHTVAVVKGERTDDAVANYKLFGEILNVEYDR